jgi:hypothetical protein
MKKHSTPARPSPLATVNVGTSFSPLAYCDANGRPATIMPTPTLAVHHFEARADGQMEHHIDGRLRAIVPPEGLADYARYWPDCLAVARTLASADHR